MRWSMIETILFLLAASLASMQLRADPVNSTAKIPFLVILDPGHGGEDTGAVQAYDDQVLFEKHFSLQLAVLASSLFRMKEIPVILTRSNDVAVTLDQRISVANHWAHQSKHAIFISIHANSSNNSSSSGVETYVFNATTNDAAQKLADLENGRRHRNHNTLDLILTDLSTTANYEDSVELACSVQDRVVSGLTHFRIPAKNRGIKQAFFYVLMQTRIPSILFEAGFTSNRDEFHRLLDPRYRHLLARELVEGVMQWRVSVDHKTTNPTAVSAIRKKNCALTQ